MVVGGGLWLALCFAGIHAGAIENETLRLSTGIIFRELTIVEGKLSTSQFGREGDGVRLSVGDHKEFELIFVDGGRASAQDFRVLAVDQKVTPDLEITISLTPRQANLPKVRLIYSARKGEAVLRKRIEVEGDRAVDQINVESLKVTTLPDVGGFGQPVYLDGEWFAGLEYPAGTSDVQGDQLRCFHFPGRGEFTSKTAVIGTRTGSLRIEEQFERYVESIRRPPRSLLMYAGWFDRRKDELTPTACAAVFESLKKNLLDPYHIKLDTYLVDDGYQKPDSLWQAGESWPGGFDPFRDQLEAGGSHLGLWLPLNGRGLDTSWGIAQGWKKAAHEKSFYWLPDAKYQAALRDVLTKYVRDSRVVCFKHDFNIFDGSSNDRARPSTERHNKEAIVDATLELLEFERGLNKDLFLSVTSGLWPSPWWLTHADAIWMGYADYDHDWSFPQAGDREAEMTYRDDKMYRRIRVERAQFPIASLMTHGIIRGRLDHTAPEESLADWSDYVTMFFGRGTQLQELYLSPEVMPDSFWQVLGKGIRWAKKHEETLRHSVMIGGSPSEGEAYGYAHWSRDLGIFVVRNPSIVPASFVVDWSSRPSDLPGTGDWTPVVVYPVQQRLKSVTLSEPIVLSLPGRSVTVLHVYSKLPEVISSVPVGRFDLDVSADEATLALLAPPRDGDMQTTGELVDEREVWKGAFQVSGRLGGDVTIECRPANGMSIEIAGASEVSRRHADRREMHLWETTRYQWPGSETPTSLGINMTLPPTPLWPQRARVRAALRMRTTLVPAEERSLSASTESPEWPFVGEPRTFVTERVLLDGKTFSRGRSVMERVVWFLLLVILPITVIQSITTRFVRGRSTSLAWMIRTVIAFSVAFLYLLTPLGTWIIRAMEN